MAATRDLKLTGLIVVLAASMLSGMSRAEQALQLVDELDLERYQGSWYEIARLPNRFQSDCAGEVSARYQLRDDGRIDVTNRCRRSDGSWIEAQGIARRAEADGPPAALEVRFAPRWLSFLPFVWGDYRVIALGEDYDHALVGSEDREFLWVLAREPVLPQATFDRLIDRARSQGFDTDHLVRTEQSL